MSKLKKNLDGETNLKHKQSNKDIFSHCKSEFSVINLKDVDIYCDKPSERIYQFEGVIMINKKRVALTYENFLLRGSSLRNTEWIYGTLSYTGHDTRIMKNSSGSKAKASKIEK